MPPGGEADPGARCALCHRGAEAARRPLLLGGVLASCGPLLGPFHDGRQGRVYVHRLCALWSPEVFQDGDRLRNVMAAVRRGRQLSCSVCGQKGATVGCRLDWCPKTYHLHCAAGGGCEFQTDGSWVVSCPAHRVNGKEAEARAAEVARIRRNNRAMGGGVAGSRKRMLEAGPGGAPGMAAGAEAQAAAPAPADHDRDEEMFQRKQQRRLARDVAALAPKVLGGAETRGAGTCGAARGWASVGGLDHVVNQLKEMVVLPLLYGKDLQALHIQPPRGILLHGEPGTGKTHVVRALAGALGQAAGRPVTFFSRKGADCLGKFHGDAERTLRILFEEASRKQPSIVFFDEIDGLAPARGSRADPIHASVVSSLLCLMDGVADRGQVIVVGATNRPDAIDPALRRPGRFDREVHFPLPEMAARKAIFAVHTKHWEHPPDESTLAFLAGATHRYAGADIRALCSAAVLCAVRERMPKGLPEPTSGRGEGSLQALRDSCPRLNLDSLAVERKHWQEALTQVAKPCSNRSLHSALSLDAQRRVPWTWVPCLSGALVPALEWLASVSPSASEAVRAVARAGKEYSGLNGHSTVEATLERAGAVQNTPAPSQAPIQSVEGDDRQGAGGRRDTSNTGGSLGPTHVEDTGRNRRTLLVCGQDFGGQEDVACATLSAAAGFSDIHVASLPALLSAGNGDPAVGAAQVATEAQQSCKPGRPSLIFLPKLETWAFSEARLDESGGRDEAADRVVENALGEAVKQGGTPLSLCGTPQKGVTGRGFEGIQDAQERSWTKRSAPSPAARASPLVETGAIKKGENGVSDGGGVAVSVNVVLPAWKMFVQVISRPCAGPLCLVATTSVPAAAIPEDVLHVFQGGGRGASSPPSLNRTIEVAEPSEEERQEVIGRVARMVAHEFSLLFEALEQGEKMGSAADEPVPLGANATNNENGTADGVEEMPTGTGDVGRTEGTGPGEESQVDPALINVPDDVTPAPGTAEPPAVKGEPAAQPPEKKPRGRPPKGKVWDAPTGQWLAGEGMDIDGAEESPEIVNDVDLGAGSGGLEQEVREEDEDVPPCCVCSARDGPNQILCMMPGCGRSAHPRCVKERRKSTTWMCALCARPKLLEDRRREKMGEIEAAGLKWIGGSILHDQRCAVACSAEPSRSEWYGAADLAAVATLAAQGGYVTHEDLALALRRAASIGQKAEHEALKHRGHALGQPRQDYSTRAAALAGLLDTAEGWLYDLQKHLRTTGRTLLREQRQEEIFAQASGKGSEDTPPQEPGGEEGAECPRGRRAPEKEADPGKVAPLAALAGLSKEALAAALEAELRGGLQEALGPAWGLRAAEDAARCALAESRAALLRRLRPAIPGGPGGGGGGPAAVRAAVRRALAP